MSKFKWDNDSEAVLANAVANDDVVSLSTVSDLAEQLGTSERSVAAKLRHMEYGVERVGDTYVPTFTDADTQALEDFVNQNSGKYTYSEIADVVFNGDKSARQVQGKILSLELTGHVKASEPKAYKSSYTDADTATITSMIESGASLEAIAEAVNRPLNSVRGKCLSLMNQHPDAGWSFPTQANKVESVDPMDELGDVSGMTVAEIANAIGKTERGVKTMLTRRGIDASDYAGAKKRAKLDEAA